MPPKKFHTFYDFCQSHLAALLKAANSVDWNNLLRDKDEANEQAALITSNISDFMGKCIPTRTVAITLNDKPWIDDSSDKSPHKRSLGCLQA